MPIRAGAASQVTRSTRPARLPEQHVRLRLRRLSTDAVLDLDAAPWRVRPGVLGLDDLATELVQESAAGAVGSVVTGMSYPPREVFLPLSVRADRLDGLRGARAALRAVAPLGELVRLEVLTDTSPGQVLRWADCYRVTRDDTAWSSDAWSIEGWQVLGLSLTCPDPWVHSDPISWRWAGATTRSMRLPLRLPHRLGPANLSGRARSLDVIGDARCHGTWTLGGPMTSLTATLPATGETWTLTPPTPLLDGEKVTVHTDPRVARTGLRVIGPDGSSWWRHVQTPRRIWSLPPEAPEVLVDIVGSGWAELVVTPSWEAFL